MKNIQEGNSKNTPRLQTCVQDSLYQLYSIFFKCMKTGRSLASSEDPDKISTWLFLERSLKVPSRGHCNHGYLYSIFPWFSVKNLVGCPV